MVGFHLVDHRHITIPLKFGQVTPDEIAKFFQTVVRFFDRRPEAIKHLFGSVAEKLHQNVIFIFEIKIDGSVGHSGLFGNLGNGRLVKSMSGKNLNRRLKNLMIFMIFFDLVRGCPHLAILSKNKK